MGYNHTLEVKFNSQHEDSVWDAIQEIETVLGDFLGVHVVLVDTETE